VDLLYRFARRGERQHGQLKRGCFNVYASPIVSAASTGGRLITAARKYAGAGPSAKTDFDRFCTVDDLAAKRDGPVNGWVTNLPQNLEAATEKAPTSFKRHP